MNARRGDGSLKELVDALDAVEWDPDEDQRWFANEGERAFALPPGVDNGDVDCELCGRVHEADVECG